MHKNYLPPGADYASFAKRLRRWRILRGYSQQELANVTGVSLKQISNLEMGYHLPFPSTAEKLADALGIQTIDLWDFE